MEKEFGIVLAGNPNSGKTTLFNRLTGAHYKVGNYGGVTVEKKSGYVKSEYCKSDTVAVCDTPGVYSLSEKRAEEKAAISVLKEKNDLIIDVIDASSLSRSLLLCAEINRFAPVIIALNMYDEFLADGKALDIPLLSSLSGVEIFVVNARSGEGCGELIGRVLEIKNGAAVKKPEIAGMNEGQIHKIADRVIRESKPKKQSIFDRILCNPVTSLPIFVCVIAAVLSLTFGTVGNGAADCVNLLFERVICPAFCRLPVGGFFSSLLFDGFLSPAEEILSFLPQIMLLCFMLSCLEGVGYMSRVCFALDSVFCRMGLDGRAAIPLILGFGCSVTAVMSARTLEGEGRRKAMIAFSPFVSCSARNAVFAVMVSVFFPRFKALVITGLYALSVAVAIFFCAMSAKVKRERTIPFLTELPRWRMPDVKYIFGDCLIKGRDFLFKACAIIIPASALIFLLSYFTPSFSPAKESESILAIICEKISPLFSPLGFGDKRAAAALISGIFAKESIVSSMSVLYGNPLALSLASSGFTAASALSFCVFSLFYFPCAATVAAIARESKSVKFTLKALALYPLTAYTLALITYRLTLFVTNMFL